MSKKIFIVTGEHSGDIHASYVIKELKKLFPDIIISGVGAKEMSKAGASLFSDHSDMAVVGLDSFKKIPEHVRLGAKILKYLKNEFNPDLILLIDYGGFNLRLARELKKNNFKVFYYISPQVWASRKGRLKCIKAYVDKMMLILPFEEQIHRNAGVNAEFVGHPLVSQMPEAISKADFCHKHHFDESKPLIGLFPGSRKMEINFLLEIFIKTAVLIAEELPEVQFCLAQSSNINDDYLHTFLQKANPQNKLNLQILKNVNHNILSASDLAILASGTVTLEAAIYNTPMIISYKSYWLAYFLYLILRNIDCIGLPNIIAQKNIIPELLQTNAKPELISREALRLINNHEERNKMLKDLADINKALTKSIASARVAEIIYKELNDEQ